MLYNTKQLYTPALEAYEFNERALIVDTETIGAGAGIEIIEIALADAAGNVLFDTLVQPVSTLCRRRRSTSDSTRRS
jgi:hypothetical protein